MFLHPLCSAIHPGTADLASSYPAAVSSRMSWRRGVAGSRDGTPGAKEERLLGDDGHILSVS